MSGKAKEEELKQFIRRQTQQMTVMAREASSMGTSTNQYGVLRVVAMLKEEARIAEREADEILRCL